MRTTVIFNAKGGVGKTVTAVNMAAELATRPGCRGVALLDCDPQGNASTFCGADTDAATTYDVLMGTAELYYPENMQTARFGGTVRAPIDILPASSELILADIASQLHNKRIWLRALRDLVECMAEDEAYDYVIIDCPPSFSAATCAALIAADDVIVPIKLDAFSVDGLGEITLQIDGMRQFNPRLRIAGALITMRDANTVVARDVELALRSSAIPVFKETIRKAEAVNASTFQRLPLCYMPGKAARGVAADYANFVSEYLEGGPHHG